jgi:hypothetical protein
MNKWMMINKHMIGMVAVFCVGLCASCKGGHGSDPKPVVARAGPVVAGPPGYDLGAPKKYIVPESLHEISGICLLKNNPDTMYAIEDETGRLFHFHLGDGRFPAYKFGGHGDYEDVTILNDAEFVVLRSDGSLFVFPLGLIRGGDKKAVKVYEHILPKGEYEGVYFDPGDGEKSTSRVKTADDGPSDKGPKGLSDDEGGRLIVLCKNCPDDDQRDEVSAYVLQYDDKHVLRIKDHFFVQVPASRLHSIHSKVKFHPSCVARHPLTKDWYIVSSVNKVLIVFDGQWKVKGMYDLDPVLFKQPEGLAFDNKGNMYISNEGVQGNANVLVFSYKP